MQAFTYSQAQLELQKGKKPNKKTGKDGGGGRWKTRKKKEQM